MSWCPFYIIFSISLLYPVGGLQGQNIEGEVTYRVSSATDSAIQKLHETGASEELKGRALRIIQSASDFHLQLIFNEESSICTREEKMINEGRSKSNITEITGGAGDVVYRHSTSNETLIKKGILPGVLVQVSSPNWKLEPERKSVLGRMCYKATADIPMENSGGKFTKSITAWYDPEIPLNYGPYTYFGLPGLILEVDAGNIVYTATEIKMGSSNGQKISRPNGKVITQDEAREKIEENYLFIRNTN